MIDAADYLQISGLQHFCFCRRQWALIHIEQQWTENQRTAEGRLMHERCHDDMLREKRGDLLIMRGMRAISHRLRLTGVLDVVELRADPEGVALQNQPGLWLPMPVEYKRGSPKENDADRLQLCAQAMALEEMFVCDIPRAALYYGATRRREDVELTPELRQKTQSMADEMNAYFARGHTPKARMGRQCEACSLKGVCLPELCRTANAADYVRAHINEHTRKEGDEA